MSDYKFASRPSEKEAVKRVSSLPLEETYTDLDVDPLQKN